MLVFALSLVDANWEEIFCQRFETLGKKVTELGNLEQLRNERNLNNNCSYSSILSTMVMLKLRWKGLIPSKLIGDQKGQISQSFFGHLDVRVLGQQVIKWLGESTV